MFAKTVLAIVFMLASFTLPASARAGGSSNSDGGERGSPHAADLIFTISYSRIGYRSDGHMMVCVDKKEKVVTECRSAKDQMTLDEFWRWYFPQAPTLRVVAMDYRTYYSTYIFWLKR